MYFNFSAHKGALTIQHRGRSQKPERMGCDGMREPAEAGSSNHHADGRHHGCTCTYHVCRSLYEGATSTMTLVEREVLGRRRGFLDICPRYLVVGILADEGDASWLRVCAVHGAALGSRCSGHGHWTSTFRSAPLQSSLPPPPLPA